MMDQKELHQSLKSKDKKISSLKRNINRALVRFPKWLDSRLVKGLERTIVNSSSQFFANRAVRHLQSLLLAQFLLQKKMENSLQDETRMAHPLFLKLFQSTSRICVALTFLDRCCVSREDILKVMQILLPGILEIPHSFYSWHHPEHGYLFSYLEVQKLRGLELCSRELKKLEAALQEQLHSTPPLTPILFWPYNEEESFRQVQLLMKEIRSKEDIPNVSIQFQEQTSSSLEFLIHLARPQAAESLNRSLERLPDYLDFFCHFQRIVKKPFPIELGAFALKVPAHAFNMRDSINLLYARRYILKYLEGTLGACRDYNGGLFEKQQQHFELLRVNLSDKIPLFEFFAEKLFYALHPVEKRLMLTLKDAENLFLTFSNKLQGKEVISNQSSSMPVAIVKAAKSSDLHRLSHVCQKSNQIISQAQLSFGGYHYLCLLGPGASQIKLEVKNNAYISNKTKTLRLVFEEGKPTSLNPYYSISDMRCRLLSKLLFEGLVRLNSQGEPELAGAKEYALSNEGKVYTFKLRSNYWSNGERVTAIDYANSLQKALKGYFSHPEIYFVIKNAANLKRTKHNSQDLGIRVLDADTLQIELEQPDPLFLHQLAQPFFFPLFGSLQEPKWFNGPFLVREQSKESLWLERNPYFWDAKNLFYEEIEIRWISDVEAINKNFQEKRLDWVGDPLTTLPLQFISDLENQGQLLQQEASRRFILCFNTNHIVLSSPLIRRALSLAIDRAFICQTIFPKSIPLESPAASLEEVRALFEKGLAKLGLSRENCPRLTFSYSHQERREKLGLYLKNIWETFLGISIQLEKIEWNQFRNRLEKGLFDISGTIQGTQGADSPHFYEKLEGTSSWNFSKWVNPLYKSLVAQAKLEKEENKRKELLKQAQYIIEQEAPFTPLFKYTHLFAHTPHLMGYLFDNEGCVDFSRSFLKDGI